MYILKYLAALIAVAPLVCSAASQINADQVTCSGTQTTDSTNGLQIDCVGSLTVVGGSLVSDSFIKLTATDALYLDSITVTAPTIDLAGATISYSGTAKFDSTNLTANNRSVVPVPVSGSLSLPSGSTGGRISISGNGSGSLALTNGGGSTNGSISAGARGRIPLAGNGSGSITLANGAGGVCSSSGVPSVFQVVESGTHYCAGHKNAFHRIKFFRTTAECHTAPTSFEIASTQDFPQDGSTQSKIAECSNIGTGNSSCVLYDAIDGSGNLVQPYAGRLALKWGRNGKIHSLEGHVIEKTLDGCHSESTLKFVRRIHP